MFSIKKYKKYENEFRSTFGVGLKRFWDGIFGFDIVKFDDWMVKHQGYDIDEDGSLSDFIEKNYGQEAVLLINNLIK